MNTGGTPDADALIRAWIIDLDLPDLDDAWETDPTHGSEPVAAPTSARSPVRGRAPAPERFRRVPGWSHAEIAETLDGAISCAVDALARDLVTDVGLPADELGVAALLESRGLRDEDARNRYACADIFVLAHDVHGRCVSPAPGEPMTGSCTAVTTAEQDAREQLWRRGLARFARYYSRGLFFALPLAVQVASLVLFGYGSWASVNFTTREATTVALGTVCSFIAVGGVAQVIAKLGNFYLEQHSFVLARTVMTRLALHGFAGVAVVGALLALAAKAAGVLPGPALAVALGYYVLLSVLFLSLAVLHTLQHRLAIMLTMVANLAMVIGMVDLMGTSTMLAHWAGLATWSVLAFAWGQVVLRRRAASARPTAETHGPVWAPRLRIMSFTAWRHMLYGSMYFGFLFADRIVAWTADTGVAPIVFRSAYEVGLDWALLSLILTIAMLEYTINDLAALVPPVQRSTAANQREALNRAFRRLYLRHLVMLLVVAAISVNITYFIATHLYGIGSGAAIHAIATDPISARVFEASAVAYSLLAVCLLNTVLFFSVSRPSMALWPLAAALVTDVTVGTVMSRVGEWWWAVGGLLAGVVVFAVLTTALSVRVLRRLDYYYYAA